MPLNLSLVKAAYPIFDIPGYVPSPLVSSNPNSITPYLSQVDDYNGFAELLQGPTGSIHNTYALTLNAGLTGINSNIQQDVNATLNPVANSPQTVYNVNPNSLNVPYVRMNNESEALMDMSKIEQIDPPFDNYAVPNTLQKYPGIPLFFEMIDASNTQKGILVNNNFFKVTTLKLTPNPENMIINSAKKINRFYTLSGWVEEHWGDEIDTVSFSGSTFSFFGLKYGLTSEFRTQTYAYDFIKELVHLYQLNGCIYQNASDYEGSDTPAVVDFLRNNLDFVGNHPRKGLIKERLYLRMTYDYLTLLGRFETFDIIEDATKPFRLTYNIIFKAERTLYTLDVFPSQLVGPPSPFVGSQSTK